MALIAAIGSAPSATALSDVAGEGPELIVLELRQLRRAEHRVVAHQHRRLDLGVAVFCRVQVEHELLEGAGKPRQRPFQHDKARAREFRRRLEVHQAQRLAELEMLLRLVQAAEFRPYPPAANLDIVGLVLAVRNIVERQVGNLGERDVERGAQFALDGLEFRHGRLEAGDLRLEVVGRRKVLARYGGADLLRGCVAALLGALQIEDRGAPLLVERDQRFGQGAEPAPGEARIERLRIVAYRLDVVHKSPGIEGAAQPAVAEHVEREARHYQKRAGKLNRP